MGNQVDNRLLVLETLVDVEKENIYVKDALGKLLYQQQFLAKQERAFITRLIEGVCEYRIKLDYIINAFSKTPTNKCKPVIRCILRMAVYQMLYMDNVPNEVACDEAVKLAKKKGFQNLSGFVNGVLRNIARNLDSVEYPSKSQDITKYFSVMYSMPEWLVDELIGWYGVETTEQILEASVSASPLTIRFFSKRMDQESFIKLLQEKDITVEPGLYVDQALRLSHYNHVKKIPGFKEGDFFVQDESSMLLGVVGAIQSEVAKTSSDTPFTVLDLCAAPGGKSTMFAQLLGDKGIVEARDISEKKIDLIRENIERLHLNNIHVRVQDACELDEDMIGQADMVIADLPCSGLGILAKKNDIKYHVTKEQLQELIDLQRTMLDNAAVYVKPGGVLLYSTCTIHPGENIDNAKWFLSQHDFEAESIKTLLPTKLHSYLVEDYALQLIQKGTMHDGFFISKFRRK